MQLLGFGEELLLLRLDNKLADTGMIPEINKNKPSMIPFSMNPASKPDGAMLTLRTQ
jgi:hypothetical protein